MKKITILGAFLGFLIGASLGLAQGVEWASLVWRASISAVAAGVLFRWWSTLLIRGLRESHLEKLNATEAASNGTAATAKS